MEEGSFQYLYIVNTMYDSFKVGLPFPLVIESNI